MFELVKQAGAWKIGNVMHTVEPDASGASYFLAAAAVNEGSRVKIEGLGKKSLQGDAGFAEIAVVDEYTPTAASASTMRATWIARRAMPGRRNRERARGRIAAVRPATPRRVQTPALD